MRRVVEQVRSRASKQSRVLPEMRVTEHKQSALSDEVAVLLDRIDELIG